MALIFRSTLACPFFITANRTIHTRQAEKSKHYFLESFCFQPQLPPSWQQGQVWRGNLLIITDVHGSTVFPGRPAGLAISSSECIRATLLHLTRWKDTWWVIIGCWTSKVIVPDTTRILLLLEIHLSRVLSVSDFLITPAQRGTWRIMDHIGSCFL